MPKLNMLKTSEGTPPAEEELEEGSAIEVEEEGSEGAPAGKEVDLEREEEIEKTPAPDKRAFAEMRIKMREIEKEREALRKQLEETKRITAAPPVRETQNNTHDRRVINGVPVPETREEWDRLAKHDWQLVMDMKSILNAEKVQRENAQLSRHSDKLAVAKKTVLERHPELNDETTEKAQVFLQILNENPEYLTQANGPIYAMRDMEERLREVGKDIDTPRRVASNPDATRAARAAVMAGGKATPSTGRRVVLSKEEMEFCQEQGLKPEEFAKQKLALEASRKGA